MAVLNIPTHRVAARDGKVRFTFRTFDPDDMSIPMNFDGGTHREFDFFKDDTGTPRIAGTNGAVTYSPELEFVESKVGGTAGSAAKVGVHHLVVDLGSADANAIAFWTPGSHFLCRLKGAVLGAITYANEPLFRIYLDYELLQAGEIPGVMLQTQIATIVTQPTRFTIPIGAGTDNFYRGLRVRIVPDAAPTSVTDTTISAYTASSKQVTLASNAVVNLAIGDRVTIYDRSKLNTVVSVK